MSATCEGYTSEAANALDACRETGTQLAATGSSLAVIVLVGLILLGVGLAVLKSVHNRE